MEDNVIQTNMDLIRIGSHSEFIQIVLPHYFYKLNILIFKVIINL